MSKVLIVDDSPFFIDMLGDLLTAEGFQVITAASGEEAIELLVALESRSSEAAAPFDLLITDLVMPGLSGYDLARFVREKNRRNKFMPVIMLTDREITKEEAREHGCAAYIPKKHLKKVVTMAQTLLKRFH